MRGTLPRAWRFAVLHERSRLSPLAHRLHRCAPPRHYRGVGPRLLSTSRCGTPPPAPSLCSESLAGGAVESLDQALVLIPVFRRKRPARFQQPVDPLRKFLFAAVKLGFFKALHQRIEVSSPRRRIGETYLRRTLEVL